MQGLTWMARHALVRRWRTALSIGAVIAITGGIGLAGLATERRTASAHERFLATAGAPDLSILTVSFEPLPAEVVRAEVDRILAEAAELPGVAASSTYWGLGTLFVGGADTATDAVSGSPEFVGSLDGRFFTTDRPAIVEGRLPSIDAEDEVLINEVVAADGVGVGDRFTLDAFDQERFYSDPEAAFADGPDESIELVVVGVGVLPGEVLTDDIDRFPRVVLPPGITSRLVQTQEYAWQGLTLDGTVPVDEVIAGYQELAGERQVLADRLDDKVVGVRRALRPTRLALNALGTFALASAAILTLLLARRSALGAYEEGQVLRAVGATERARVVIAGLPAAVGAIGGALGAVLVAIGLSPLAPVGPVRRVEPDPGVDVDGAVLGVGGLAVAAVGVVLALVLAAVVERRTRPARRRSGASVLSGLIGRAPLPVGLGVQWAVGRDNGRSGAAVRLGLASGLVAFGVAVAALVFGNALEQTADEPARYGWTFDAAFGATGGYGDASAETVGPLLDADDGIEGWATLGMSPTLVLGPQLVPAIGIEAGAGTIEPLLLSGRLPSDGEVALGVRTLRELGLTLGDEVPAGRDDRPIEVVGTVAMPAVGLITADNPALGDGAWLTLATLQELDENSFAGFIAVDLADSVSDADLEELAGALTAASREDGFEFRRVLRPAELADVGATAGAARLVTVLLFVVAALIVVVTMVSSVLRRRHELQILRALGVAPPSLAAAVVVQALVGAGIVAAVGMFAGVVLGGVGWRSFAQEVGVAAQLGSLDFTTLLVGPLFATVVVVAVLPAAWSLRRGGGLGAAAGLPDG